jgi:hypothetical protein
MKKFVTLAAAGMFLFSLQGANAQREVQPPAVPPLLEGQRPLAQSETKEPTAPQQVEKEQAKPAAKAKGKKAKNGHKTKKKAKVKKTAKKKTTRTSRKKGHKANHKKAPAAEPKAAPEEG